jgi:hypothetical protein
MADKIIFMRQTINLIRNRSVFNSLNLNYNVLLGKGILELS